MKLIGNVDGVEVRFDFHPPNIFIAEIPKQLDGIYIVELKLLDDAGNEANYRNKFVQIDFSRMAFKVLEGYNEEEALVSPYGASEEVASSFSSEELTTGISSRELKQLYSYRELVIKDDSK